MSKYASCVFINCPFSPDYNQMFRAILFSVIDCGFYPKCAWEIRDSGQVRIEKIQSLIQKSKFGIHDISYAQLDPNTRLARFNMPLELGFFLGAKRYGTGAQKQKCCLILDSGLRRYEKFISDIKGQDIEQHRRSPKNAIQKVRDFLKSASSRKTIPSAQAIKSRYAKFEKHLEIVCKETGVTKDSILYADLFEVTEIWVRKNPV